MRGPAIRLVAAVLLAGVQPAAALSIRNSKHDLSASSTTTGPKATTEAQLCVFCHTPHKPNPNVPLWNKVQTTQAFTFYSSNYLNTYLQFSTPAPAAMNGTITKMCLSCHDGITAIGGVYNLNGAPGTITMSGPLGAAANLGTNLGDDHPVLYPVSPGSGIAQDPEIVLPPAGDRVKIYDPVTHRPQATPASGGLVECGSCHDPHDNQFGKFLVKSNANAAICTTCHAKTGFAAGIHRTSAVAYTPPGEPATTVGEWACRDCHRMHGASAIVANQKYQLRGAEEGTCFACHGNPPLTGAKNVQTPLGLAYVHPTADAPTRDRHRNPETDASRFSVANRHAECQDCHHPHQTRSGNRLAKASPSNLITNVLLGAWGVEPTYAATKGTAPTGYTRRVFSNTATDKEFWLCFKCHSSYAYGGTPPGGYTDQSIEFNPLNDSRHPVVSAGANPYCTPTATNGNVVTMVAPWNDTANEHNTMMCSDCHGSDNAAHPEGPHGSAQYGMLQGSLVAVQYAAYGNNYGTPFCLRCHASATYIGKNAPGSRYGDHPGSQGAHSRTPAEAGSFGYGGCLVCHGRLLDNPNYAGDGIRGSFHGYNGTFPSGSPAARFLAFPTTFTNWTDAAKTCVVNQTGGCNTGHNKSY